MIEVLVAVVVLSLGMLGVLGVHARGFTAVDSAGYRTQATFLAGEILERARANPGSNYSIAFGAATAGSGTTATDLSAWKTLLARAMPMGDGQITVTPVVDPASGLTYNRLGVLVRWDDRRAEYSGTGSPVYKHFMTEGFQIVP